ncbi:MAG: hypothetical protein A2171_01495 [Candidatus Levybacteria bacterium RBG_13_35_9]|nr:MAG: hypothetical protein A2171_01495 [Candidatus Levybacteria bacterium RBG_13_35_9]
MKLFLKNLLEKVKFVWKKFLSLSKAKKAVIIIILAVFGFFGYQQIIGKSSTAPQYQTSQAEKGTLVSSVSASGTVSSAGSADITTQASGVVSEVYVKTGDYVYAGQNVASITLDQTSAQKQAAAYATYLSVVSNLNAVKSKMNSLQSALFKANQAFVNGKGTIDPDTDDPVYIEQRADWLQAEADYNNQSGVITAAQASLNSASLTLSQTSSIITAPISGIVTNLALTPGLSIETSQADSSSSTTSNSQTVGSVELEGAKTQASVNLTEIDVTKVKVGQKVTLTLDAFEGKTFTGKVSSIDTNGSVSSGVTTYPAVITFDSAPDNVYPNMAVSVTIITNVKNDALLVPTGAVQTSNGVSYVRVQKGKQIEQVEVEVGESNDTQTEIISGLSEGDTVVTGSISTSTSTNSTTSPFGGTGFRSFGGGGGQIRVETH